MTTTKAQIILSRVVDSTRWKSSRTTAKHVTLVRWAPFIRPSKSHLSSRMTTTPSTSTTCLHSVFTAIKISWTKAALGSWMTINSSLVAKLKVSTRWLTRIWCLITSSSSLLLEKAGLHRGIATESVPHIICLFQKNSRDTFFLT